MGERLSPDDYFQWRVPAKIYGNGNGYVPPVFTAQPLPSDKTMMFFLAMVAICFLATVAYLGSRK